MRARGEATWWQGQRDLVHGCVTIGCADGRGSDEEELYVGGDDEEEEEEVEEKEEDEACGLKIKERDGLVNVENKEGRVMCVEEVVRSGSRSGSWANGKVD